MKKKIKLSRREIQKIRAWLRRKKTGHIECPFTDPWCHKNSKTCKLIFPKLPKREGSTFLGDDTHQCPCAVYPFDYVRKVAKKAIT